jgi:hypothetical protein
VPEGEPGTNHVLHVGFYVRLLHRSTSGSVPMSQQSLA